MKAETGSLQEERQKDLEICHLWSRWICRFSDLGLVAYIVYLHLYFQSD